MGPVFTHRGKGPKQLFTQPNLLSIYTSLEKGRIGNAFGVNGLLTKSRHTRTNARHRYKLSSFKTVKGTST
jgi:hypothetical protein